jgi:hypothetical protein
MGNQYEFGEIIIVPTPIELWAMKLSGDSDL